MLIGAVAIGLLFLLAFTVSGARSLGRDKGHPDYGSVGARAAVGASVALALGGALLLAARYVARRDNPIARLLVPERPITTRALLARSLPWLAVLVALGGVLGAATAPLYRTGTSAQDDSTGRPVDPRVPELDSRLATDTNERTVLQIDPDGDGLYESLVPCPDGEGSNDGSSTWSAPEPSPDDPLLVPVDYECDGKIDAYARLESLESQARVPATRTNPPRTSPTTTPPPATLPDNADVRPDDPPLDTYGNDADLVTDRYDGIYARDANGDIRLYIDADGNGTYETPMNTCPPGTGARVPSTSLPDTGTALVPIDEDCDGVIDAYARVEDFDPRATPPREATSPTAPPTTRGVEPTTAPPTTVSPRDSDADTDSGGGGLPPPIIVLLVMAAGAAIVGVAYIASRSLLHPAATSDTKDPDPAEPVADTTDTSAATDAIRSSLDDLATPPDPREAIITAYARLLQGLSDGGMPRRPSETPGQYLHRCVEELGVSREPMEQLTELFALARFSSHPVTEMQRAAATACLERSLADLHRRSGPLTGAAR